MTLLFWIIWITGSLSVFRRAAWVRNEYLLKGHDFSSSCQACNKKDRIHVDACILGGLVSLLVWPVLLLGHYGIKTGAYLGITPGDFFVPPKEIVTKDERAVRKQEEVAEKRELRIKELENVEAELKATNKVLEGMGIEV